MAQNLIAVMTDFEMTVLVHLTVLVKFRRYCFVITSVNLSSMKLVIKNHGLELKVPRMDAACSFCFLFITNSDIHVISLNDLLLQQKGQPTNFYLNDSR